MTLRTLAFVAGLLHFYEVPAIIFLPQRHHWREDIARLAPVNLKIVSILRGGMFVVVLGLGAVVMLGSGEIASGGKLPAFLTCFLAVMWGYRGSMQILSFSGQWPAGWTAWTIHHLMTALFTFLAGAYLLLFLCAAFK